MPQRFSATWLTRISRARFGAQSDGRPDFSVMATEFQVTPHTVARWFRLRSPCTLTMPQPRIEQLLHMAVPGEELLTRERADFQRADSRVQVISRHSAALPADWKNQHRLDPHLLVLKRFRLCSRHFLFTVTTGYVGSPYLASAHHRGEVIEEVLLPTGYHSQLLCLWLLHERRRWRVIAGGSTGEHTSQAWLAGAPPLFLEITRKAIEEQAGTGLLPQRLQELWSGK